MFLEHHPTFGTQCIKLRLTGRKNWCVLLVQSEFCAVFRSHGIHTRKCEICFQILTLLRWRHRMTVFVGQELHPVPSEVQLF